MNKGNLNPTAHQFDLRKKDVEEDWDCFSEAVLAAPVSMCNKWLDLSRDQVYLRPWVSGRSSPALTYDS